MRVGAALVVVPALVLCFAAGYSYVSFARMIDARLNGERERVLPRVFARPLELRRGQSLTDKQLVDRLNDLGYTERESPEKPGEFTVGDGVVEIVPRSASFKGQHVRAVFRPPTPQARKGAKRTPPRADRVQRLQIGSKASDRLTLDAPLLTSLISGEREKRRPVALAAIPPHVVQAVLATEDRRFYDHPGIDPIGMARALVTNLTGKRPYLEGASTITQQLARNFFLVDALAIEQATGRRSLLRKIREQFMSLVLERRASKDEILELYLNDVYLGQRGSFAVHGVAQAARLFFGKDVTNLTLAEAALIAGIIQAPASRNPFVHPERAMERRNVVLNAMADAGFITADVAERTAKSPMQVVQRALEAEAPYFVDYVGQTIAQEYPGLTTTTNQAVDVYTTLDLHMQRLAQDAVRNGLTRVDELLSRRKRKGRAEAALIAVDPRTGEILSLVGGRSYNQSQYNRAIVARRQPGSVFKPFVFLAAFEQGALSADPGITPAALVQDEPTTWEVGDKLWSPENYEREYDGAITFRRALALSRNIATIKVAERAGYEHVAEVWKRLGVGSTPKAYPSIALGVFEATPLEIATAYTVFPNLGTVRPLRHIARILSGDKNVTRRAKSAPKSIAQPDATFLVTNMMRSVINEGTGAGARSAGFSLDAAGKTGTTNDLRDAWFVGFTPELLTVVWVGFDDNQPLGLSGSQAALPIWTEFMTRALAGRANVQFEAPDGISYVDIDPDTGKLALPTCPRSMTEAFVAGTEPLETCELHRF